MTSSEMESLLNALVLMVKDQERRLLMQESLGKLQASAIGNLNSRLNLQEAAVSLYEINRTQMEVH